MVDAARAANVAAPARSHRTSSCALRCCSLEHGAHPRGEGPRRHRLGEVVLGAQVQGFFLAVAVLCGAHDDWHRRGPQLVAQLIEDAVPIEAGRLGVEDERIRAAPASAREFR